MDTFHEAVAEWLRGWSARERVTQAELGRVLGVKQQGISNRLSGSTPFTVDELHEIVAHWGLDMHQLIAEARGIWLQKSVTLAADEEPAPTDRQRWEAEHDSDEPA